MAPAHRLSRRNVVWETGAHQKRSKKPCTPRRPSEIVLNHPQNDDVRVPCEDVPLIPQECLVEAIAIHAEVENLPSRT
jgi:hypothetical protein